MKSIFLCLLFLNLSLFAKVNYENENVMEDISESLKVSNENLESINEKLSKLNHAVEKLLDIFKPLVFDNQGKELKDPIN